jgi:hypothetical protein
MDNSSPSCDKVLCVCVCMCVYVCVCSVAGHWQQASVENNGRWSKGLSEKESKHNGECGLMEEELD